MRTIILTSAALLVVTGCTSESDVDLNERDTTVDSSTTFTTAAVAAPQLPPTDPTNLADPAAFTQQAADQNAYYFSTPSGRWLCAIVPGDKALCEGVGGALNITGAPNIVMNAAGTSMPPNAIVVDRQGDAHFAAFDAARFKPPAPATVLPFGKTLRVLGFRCNLQEATGVSCLSEESGKGFTFSADGYTLQYSEVPVAAP